MPATKWVTLLRSGPDFRRWSHMWSPVPSPQVLAGPRHCADITDQPVWTHCSSWPIVAGPPAHYDPGAVGDQHIAFISLTLSGQTNALVAAALSDHPDQRRLLTRARWCHLAS